MWLTSSGQKVKYNTGTYKQKDFFFFFFKCCDQSFYVQTYIQKCGSQNERD